MPRVLSELVHRTLDNFGRSHLEPIGRPERNTECDRGNQRKLWFLGLLSNSRNSFVDAPKAAVDVSDSDALRTMQTPASEVPRTSKQFFTPIRVADIRMSTYIIVPFR